MALGSGANINVNRKVYCEDCEHYKVWYGANGSRYDQCSPVVTGNYWSRTYVPTRMPSKLNARNDCEFFKIKITNPYKTTKVKNKKKKRRIIF